jgi:hypothetical protein
MQRRCPAQLGHVRVHDGQQADAGGIDAERPRAEADQLKAARLEQVTLERVPATLGPDGEEDAVTG